MIKNIRALVVIAAMVLFPMSVFAEDVPMTEEEVYFEEDISVETEEDEEFIVAEEDGFLEEDGLVAAEDDEELQVADNSNSGTCGENVYWKIDNEGNLVIYGNGEMTNYGFFSSKAPWYDYTDDIKKVVIENGVTSIGEYAFHNCRSLTSIEIPDGVTSIGKHAFGNCSSLESMTIPNSVTSIGTYTFSGCSGLGSITISNSVMSIGENVFVNCSSLTNILIPNSVTSIGYGAFQNCSGLTGITISAGVTSIGYRAFKGCSGLTSITIPDSVTSIEDDAFTGCDSLAICCHHSSYAEEFAKKHNIKLSYIHTWDSGTVTKAATATSTGIRTYTCTVCGETKTESIPKLKANNPAEKKTITKKPSIKKPTAKKTSITVKWKHFKHTSKKAKKIWKKIKKVQVQCATDKACKNIVKDVKVSRGKTKYTIKGLSKKTTYYVRARYFDGVGYSNWSKVKKVKTK